MDILRRTDMHSGLFKYGGPDRVNLLMARVQLLSEYYGCPTGVHGGKTDSCFYNERRGREGRSMLFALGRALDLGGRAFSSEIGCPASIRTHPTATGKATRFRVVGKLGGSKEICSVITISPFVLRIAFQFIEKVKVSGTLSFHQTTAIIA